MVDKKPLSREESLKERERKPKVWGESTFRKERGKERNQAVLNELEKLADLHSYQAVCGPVSYWPSGRDSGAKSTISLKGL